MVPPAVNSRAGELRRATVTEDMRRMAAAADSTSLVAVEEVRSSFVMRVPSIAQRELDWVGLRLPAVHHLVSGDMLLAAVLQCNKTIQTQTTASYLINTVCYTNAGATNL